MNHQKSVRVALAAMAALVIFLSVTGPSPTGQVSTTLQVSVADTTADPGQIGVEIPVYMKNYQDTVAGFAIWMQLDQPGLIELQPQIVTAGTLIEGWQYIDSRSISGQPVDVKVAALANLPDAPFVPGIAPQLGTLPLFKLLVDVANIPDTAQDRTARIFINHDQLFNFNFSDPSGQSIGTIKDSTLDTAYFVCNQWIADSCLDWEVFYEPQGPNDSVVEYWDYFSYLDTNNVYIIDGSVTVTGGYVCGDIDNDGAGPDIGDLVYLTTWMFAQGPAPPVEAAANVDGEEGVDISDLIALVDYMFQQGPELTCSGS